MNRKILIVDDSRTSRLFIQQALEIVGFPSDCFLQAASPIEGLKILESGEVVGIIVTDINMPEMSGMEFIEKINERGLNKNVHIAVISSTQSEVRDATLKAMGVAFILEKPINMPKLIKAFGDLKGTGS